MALSVAAFAGIAAYHFRIIRARNLAQRAVTFYQSGLARMENRWPGTGQTGERFSDPHHVYAADLDLFGRGSLFELLSTARTRMGEETLAKWLLAPSTVNEIAERHAAVRELRDQLDLREDLSCVWPRCQRGSASRSITTLGGSAKPNEAGVDSMVELDFLHPRNLRARGLVVLGHCHAADFGRYGRSDLAVSPKELARRSPTQLGARVPRFGLARRRIGTSRTA